MKCGDSSSKKFYLLALTGCFLFLFASHLKKFFVAGRPDRKPAHIAVKLTVRRFLIVREVITAAVHTKPFHALCRHVVFYGLPADYAGTIFRTAVFVLLLVIGLCPDFFQFDSHNSLLIVAVRAEPSSAGNLHVAAASLAMHLAIAPSQSVDLAKSDVFHSPFLLPLSREIKNP